MESDYDNQSKKKKAISRGLNFIKKECVILINKYINRKDDYNVKNEIINF